METISSKGNNPGQKYIAFFDLDRTILSINSGKILIKYAYKNGLISIPEILKALYLSFLYRFHLKDTVKIINSLTGWLKGIPESTLTGLSAEIFHDRLLKSIQPGIREIINFHKIDGGSTVILSSALLPVCRIIADHLKMDDIICSDLESRDGIYTGYPSGQFCFGKEKSRRLTEYCRAHDADPHNSWYYGDSIDDLSALDSVGHPVCVNPDKKLSIEAARRGWEILNYK